MVISALTCLTLERSKSSCNPGMITRLNKQELEGPQQTPANNFHEFPVIPPSKSGVSYLPGRYPSMVSASTSEKTLFSDYNINARNLGMCEILFLKVEKWL